MPSRKIFIIYAFQFPLLSDQQEVNYYITIEINFISYIGGDIIRKLSVKLCCFLSYFK